MNLKKLSASGAADNIRFFGLIKGTEKDYYIAEGTFAGEEEEPPEGYEPPADLEPKGTGVNKFTYWVASSTVGEWTKLPDLEPRHI